MELTVALMLGAAVAGMAVPNLAAIRAHLAVGQVAREVAVELHRTRMRAVGENALCRLVFDPVGTYARECSTDGVTWVGEAAAVALPADVQLLSSVATSPFSFDARADGTGGLAAPTFTRLGTVDAEATITVSNRRGEHHVIHVNALGRITIS